MFSMRDKWTNGYVHRLVTVQTCADGVLALMFGSSSLLVASLRPTTGSVPMIRQMAVETSRHIRRALKSPVKRYGANDVQRGG